MPMAFASIILFGCDSFDAQESFEPLRGLDLQLEPLRVPIKYLFEWGPWRM